MVGMSNTAKSEVLGINIEKRDIFGKVLSRARKEGKLPTVVYGGKFKSASYFTDTHAFKKLWRDAGENTLVALKDGAKTIEALIHEVAVHPLSGEPIHADFFVVDSSKPVEVKVTLDFTGVSPAVKNLGALFVKVMHDLEIKILPKYLVHTLIVDISKLEKFGDKIHVHNILLPESAVLITSPDEVIALVSEPKEEKEEEAVPVDFSKIEVEKKGKEPKESEEITTETKTEKSAKHEKPEKK